MILLFSPNIFNNQRKFNKSYVIYFTCMKNNFMINDLHISFHVIHFVFIDIYIVPSGFLPENKRKNNKVVLNISH